ncbi:Iron/zinc purple acid phosphatase-like protein [Galdieria sulphuraria]|uniref:Purple acid phosphatase n=1 Tax=Galdieria sulphuraria TaxID=130081 RepID=M2XHJ6_GALSU|nr:metallo-dependent acid phosphatase [Galdieria sulphuraria]EME29557.1 metallo-dependent acid phosphatase [Galdieria sulphuraria]GJD12851.1 Iron/zinc purple acid phosphatase-like protein [Galdieria sulphuraria]|eukprot:XP_005706077.1 metallo-dependent acid phosphatase [Galdieria sulphuraria]
MFKKILLLYVIIECVKFQCALAAYKHDTGSLSIFQEFERYARRTDTFRRSPIELFLRTDPQGEWFKEVLKDLKTMNHWNSTVSGEMSLFSSALVEGTWYNISNNGTCNCCDVNNPMDPFHVHLSLTGRPGEVVVSWNTAERPPDEKSCVMVSNATGAQLGLFCSSDIRTFSLGSGYSPYLCSNYSGFASHVKISSLKPGETYTYTIYGTSKNKTFPFMAPYGNTSSTTRLAFFTDIGTKGGQPVIDALKQKMNDFDYIILPGDQSYSDGYHTTFDAYLTLFEDVIASKPYMVSTGNHEGPWNFTYARNNFYWPVNESGAALDALWYSIDEGPVHYIFMNYENYFSYPLGEWEMTQPAPLSTFPGQLEWLQNDLEKFSKRRESNPNLWLIMMAHRPLTCNISGKSCEVFGPELEKEVFPLMYQYKADMYWCGHVHAYERVNPIDNVTRTQCSNCVQQNGSLYKQPPYPVQVMNGIAGRAVADNNYFTPGISYPDYAQVRIDAINYPFGGYALVQVNDTVLNFTLYNTSGTVLDSFRIEK